jgi:A/G-specific adenine glycosylase
MRNTSINPHSSLVEPVLTWFEEAVRPLPWRSPNVTPWGILVSEFMCQQTQVDRVIPRWHLWLDRWPTPADLAGADVADAIRLWERLGYPRRAKWLHESAVIIRDKHDGHVPSATEALRALPGVGEYTAAAVQAFAFGLPSVVLDTNVRRVIARTLSGRAQPRAHVTNTERAQAAALLEHDRPAEWSAAVMEFGALICRAVQPACDSCPVAGRCRWRADGYPAPEFEARKQAAFAGSDRQARGRIMSLLRAADEPITPSAIESAWHDAPQLARALDGLVKDALIEQTPLGDYQLRRSAVGQSAQNAR